MASITEKSQSSFTESRRRTAPGGAALPAIFREQRGEYRDQFKADYPTGGDSRYLRKRRGLYGTGDAHLGDPSTFYQRIEISRDLFRSEGIVKSLLERAVMNIVRDGFVAEPQTGDPKIDELLFEKWDEWANDPAQCSDNGQRCFSEYERLAVLAEYVDGESFIHIPEDIPQIQIFEADQVRTSNWNRNANNVLGIELGEFQSRVAYWIAKNGANSLFRVYKLDDLKRIPAFHADGTPRILHICKPDRASQTRCVPALTPVLEMIGLYGDISFTALVKQQMAASLAWLVETTDKAADPFGGIGAAVAGDSNTPKGISFNEVAPGAVLEMPFGKKMEMKAPNMPSSEAMEHMRVTLQGIANAIGIPLLVLTMDASDGNFSTVRFCFDIAKMGFITNQNRLEKMLHRPVYRRNIRQWITPGMPSFDRKLAEFHAQAGNKIFAHRWNKPRWPYPQPVDDTKADSMQLDYYLNDPYDIAGSRGRDADDIRDATIKYNASCVRAAIDAAQKITKETGVTINWQDIYNRAKAKGGQIIDSTEQPNVVG